MIEAMEVLWNLECKWKLSTQEATLLLACVGLAVAGLGTAMVIRNKVQQKQNKKQKLVGQESDDADPTDTGWSSGVGCGGWASIKRVLMSSKRWSRPKKWNERSCESWRERLPPLSSLPPPDTDRHGVGLDVGWQSHNSVSAVWQRPILMGEKCEMPRYSGLILYDEKGRLLRDVYNDSSYKESELIHQEKTSAVVKTTLKDLL